MEDWMLWVKESARLLACKRGSDVWWSRWCCKLLTDLGFALEAKVLIRHSSAEQEDWPRNGFKNGGLSLRGTGLHYGVRNESDNRVVLKYRNDGVNCTDNGCSHGMF